MIGNILIIITLIFYYFLFNLLLKPMPGGDYGVGYSFGLIIYGAGFIISSGLLAWNMNVNHCFDWTPEFILKHQNWFVFLGWMSFVVATIWSLTYQFQKVENEFPEFMSFLSGSKMHIWIPLLVLISSVYLINMQRTTGFAPFWLKASMGTSISISLLITLITFVLFSRDWVQRNINKINLKNEWHSEQLSTYNASIDYINNYNEATIEGLLKFTYSEHDKKRRNAAIAKIKSFNNWENDLIDILKKENLEQIYVYEDNTRYVYEFLNGNKVEHPEKFIQPILYSLKVLNNRINKSLDDPYDLELGLTDIDVVCHVLDMNFKNWAIELMPQMVILKETFAVTPAERINKSHKNAYNKEVKKYRLAITDWLESNKIPK